MKFENIQILACKFGKKVKMDYYNNLDSLNYTVEDGDIPHPAIGHARRAHPVLAGARGPHAATAENRRSR